MKKTLLSLAIAAAAVLPGVASAQSIFANTGQLCGGNAFYFCFSFDHNTSAKTLTITNTGSTPAASSLVFTSVGFNLFPFSTTLADGTNSNMVYSSDLSDITNGAGAPAGTFAGADRASGPGGVNNGINIGGVAAGEFVTFSYTGDIDWRTVNIGIHGQSGPNNCSSKLYANMGSGSVVNNKIESEYQRCGGTTVPEPASFGLVFAGLAGLAGMTALRRRNQA